MVLGAMLFGAGAADAQGNQPLVLVMTCDGADHPTDGRVHRARHCRRRNAGEPRR